MKIRQPPFSTPHHRGQCDAVSENTSKQHPNLNPGNVSLAAVGSVTLLDRATAQKLLKHLGQPPIKFVLWDGSTVSPNVGETIGTMYFHDRGALYLPLLRPEFYLGELYSEGRIEIDGDLCQCLEVVYRGIQRDGGWAWLAWLNKTLGHRKIRNTFRKAADNIHHHYDIGNDFYRLWLDREAMQYTCAYYPDPAMTLEEAQLAKMAHVCNKLQLKPGETVVEAGSGWGGFALYMAKTHDVRVKAYNISREQVGFAREKAEALGLADRVEYMLDDYRNIRGDFDVFVSVGMLEHVGTSDYALLGNVIDRCLKPGGRGLIHSIGRNWPRPMNAWIERRIFPGAYPPALREMMDIFESGRFSVLDVENLRLHYALTLQAWRQRFEANADRIESMLDEKFVRSWRLYLAGSTAAFNTGGLQLFQVLFTRERDNDIPWSRAHLYTCQQDRRNGGQASPDA
ncbi:MAG: cyclopropane-fatty-acyl-phospholipid synthase family protein [Lysobacterales bacterium]